MNNPVRQSEADRRAVAAYQAEEDHAADAFLASAHVLQFLVEQAVEKPALFTERLEVVRRVVTETNAARVAFEQRRRFRKEAQRESGETPALSVSQAASRTGISRFTLHSAIRTGKLPSFTRIERGKPATYLFREDADAFAARHRPRRGQEG